MEIITRTAGKYPLSIGTSTALESLFGVSDNQPKQVRAPVEQYDCLIVNIRTLARNFLSSYKANELINVSATDLHSQFISELVSLANVVSDQSRDHLKLSVYQLSYANLQLRLKRANIKRNFTAKQQYLVDYERKLVEYAHSKRAFLSDYLNYETTTDLIRHGGRRNVVITHYPVDLLFTSLEIDLLESHTGKIKKSFEFNTKLKRAPSDAPFNKYTLQIFGDSSGFIYPYSSAMKNELAEICKNTSTISPVMQDKRFLKVVKPLASQELRTLISSM